MKERILIALIVLGLIGTLCSLWLMMAAANGNEFLFATLNLFGWLSVAGGVVIHLENNKTY
jgi:hypothetical protein